MVRGQGFDPGWTRDVAALTRVKVLLAHRDSWQSLLAMRDLETGHTHWNPVGGSSGCLITLIGMPFLLGLPAAIVYGSSRNAWLILLAGIAYLILAILINVRSEAALKQSVREKMYL